MISKSMINFAVANSVWDTGNKVLYDMCSKYPSHDADDEIIAKVWLIGRSYAAAIERRKSSNEVGDGFYTKHVAPKIRRSRIDELLEPLKSYRRVTEGNFREVVTVHKFVTDLFSKISGMDKRSLSSKYLHFHHPALFFIYDSRACTGIRKFSDITGRASRSTGEVEDNEYRKFLEKCLVLRSFINKEHGVTLTPRQIDNLLLYADKNL